MTSQQSEITSLEMSESLVSHGDTVAYRGGTENEGHSSRLDDTFLDGIHDPVQVDVSGNDLVPGVGDPDEGFLEILIAETVRPEQTPGRCGIGTDLDYVASHDIWTDIRNGSKNIFQKSAGKGYFIGTVPVQTNVIQQGGYPD